jgi:uncharacterized membrane protein YbaN (DUF454 family)
MLLRLGKKSLGLMAAAIATTGSFIIGSVELLGVHALAFAGIMASMAMVPFILIADLLFPRNFKRMSNWLFTPQGQDDVENLDVPIHNFREKLKLVLLAIPAVPIGIYVVASLGFLTAPFAILSIFGISAKESSKIGSNIFNQVSLDSSLNEQHELSQSIAKGLKNSKINTTVFATENSQGKQRKSGAQLGPREIFFQSPIMVYDLYMEKARSKLIRFEAYMKDHGLRAYIQNRGAENNVSPVRSNNKIRPV